MKITTCILLVAGIMAASFVKVNLIEQPILQQDSTRVDKKTVSVIYSKKMTPAQIAAWKKDKKYFDAGPGAHFRVIKDTAWRQ